MPRYTYRRTDAISPWAGLTVRAWEARDAKGNHVWTYRLDFAPWTRGYFAYRNPPDDNGVAFYSKAKPRLLAMLTDEERADDCAAAIAASNGTLPVN